jgi:hypothetical protein
MIQNYPENPKQSRFLQNHPNFTRRMLKGPEYKHVTLVLFHLFFSCRQFSACAQLSSSNMVMTADEKKAAKQKASAKWYAKLVFIYVFART